LGGLFAERFKSSGRDILVSQNRFLTLLLRNGTFTEEQLRQAIESYRRYPQDYAWILRLKHEILDRADNVFFVRYGRFPTENSDFHANGDYYQICHNLQCAPDCYDEELRKLAWDVEGNPRLVEAPPKVLEVVLKVASEKGSAKAFVVILLVSLVSAIALPPLIGNAASSGLLPMVAAAGIGWMIALACALMATRPRRSEKSVVRYSCSECRSQLEAVRPVYHCPSCGVRFQKPWK
jgi:hypothetical protein